MDLNLTDITLLLDRSGSMGVRRTDAIGGVNGFVAEQRKAPGVARLTLVQFATTVDSPTWAALPLDQIPELTPALYDPTGHSTALRDALGRTITATGERLAAIPEAERPGSVVFVVVTDGHENDSREFSQQAIRQMVEHQEKVYSWSFVFLGANIDSFAQAADVGITRTSGGILNVGDSPIAFTNGLLAGSSNIAAYRMAKARGVDEMAAKVLLEYSDEQMAEQNS